MPRQFRLLNRTNFIRKFSKKVRIQDSASEIVGYLYLTLMYLLNPMIKIYQKSQLI